MNPLEINLQETFPHLPKAPVAEAALEIRVRTREDWNEASVSPALQKHLADYPNQSGRNVYAGTFKFGSSAGARSETEEMGWCGVEAKSGEGKAIAFFERDRFLFSRLEPYPGWNAFRAESLRLWDIHAALARPMELQRIGLRYINRLDISPDAPDLEQYLASPPKKPNDLALPFSGFLHRDMFDVPGYDYGVSITCALQQGGIPVTLIVDIDVFSTKPIAIEGVGLEKTMAEMRWLKNKAFFGTLARQAWETLQ